MLKRYIILSVTAIAAIAVGLLWHFARIQPASPDNGVPSLSGFDAPHPSQTAGAELRPALREALGAATGTPWDQRLDLIRQLPADLNVAESSALLIAMMEHRPPGVSAALHSSYIHEIACRLQNLPAVREPFARALATLARDSHRNATTRDYAIQHLRQVWDHASGDPALRSAIAATFGEFTTLDPAVATPALLSLHLLGAAPAAIPDGNGIASASPPASHLLPDADLFPFLTPIFAARTTGDNLPARLTANRIAGDRRLDGFRQDLLAQLTNPAEHALVRMAAANALGKIAHPGDVARLAAYEPGDDRVAAALRHALGMASRP